MICVDTTFLVDLWREKTSSISPARTLLEAHPGEDFAGRSKPDLWIAAWAAQHSAPLATRNVRHFAGLPNLSLIGY